MIGTKIQDAELLQNPTGNERIPCSDGSGRAKAILFSSINDTAQAIANANLAAQHAQAAADSMSEDYQELNSAIGTLQQNIQTLQQSIQTAQQNIQTLQQSAQTAQQSIQTAQQNIQTLQQSAQTAQQSINTVSGQLSADKTLNILILAGDSLGYATASYLPELLSHFGISVNIAVLSDSDNQVINASNMASKIASNQSEWGTFYYYIAATQKWDLVQDVTFSDIVDSMNWDVVCLQINSAEAVTNAPYQEAKNVIKNCVLSGIKNATFGLILPISYPDNSELLGNYETNAEYAEAILNACQANYTEMLQFDFIVPVGGAIQLLREAGYGTSALHYRDNIIKGGLARLAAAYTFAGAILKLYRNSYKGLYGDDFRVTMQYLSEHEIEPYVSAIELMNTENCIKAQSAAIKALNTPIIN